MHFAPPKAQIWEQLCKYGPITQVTGTLLLLVGWGEGAILGCENDGDVVWAFVDFNEGAVVGAEVDFEGLFVGVLEIFFEGPAVLFEVGINVLAFVGASDFFEGAAVLVNDFVGFVVGRPEIGNPRKYIQYRSQMTGEYEYSSYL